MLLDTNLQIASARNWRELQWNQPTFEPLGGDIKFNNNNLLHLPVVIKNRINALEAFVIWSDGSIRHIWQNKPNGGWNTNWDSLGGDFSGGFSVTRNKDDRVEVFAVGNDGIMYHRWQESNGVWRVPWQPLDGVTFGSSDPAVILNWHNELEIFAVGRDGNVYDAWQNGPGGAFLPWRSLGFCPPGCNTVVAATNKGSSGILGIGGGPGRAEIFTVGNDNQVHHRWQESNGVWRVPWQPLGDDKLARNGVTPSTPKVAMNEDGRLEVFVHTSFPQRNGSRLDEIYHAWQLEPNGRWSNWEDSMVVFTGVRVIHTEPSVTSYGDGRIAVFTKFRYYAREYIQGVIQDSPGDCCQHFGDKFDIGTGFYSAPTIVSNDDGRLEMFVVALKTHQLLHRWQVPV